MSNRYINHRGRGIVITLNEREGDMSAESQTKIHVKPGDVTNQTVIVNNRVTK
jgi:hypothetical protein